MLDIITAGEEDILKKQEIPETSPKADCPGKKICKPQYINKINYANFENLTLKALFQHKTFPRTFQLEGIPSPCLEGSLELVWKNPPAEDEDLSAFYFKSLLIPDSEKYLVIETENYSMTPEGMRIQLPDTALTLNSRACRRYPAVNVSVQILQNSTSFRGKLLDFTPLGFHIQLNLQPHLSFRWLNTDETISIILKKSDTILFSGECSIKALRENNSEKECIITPLYNRIKRFKAKKYRGERQELKSPVFLSFKHPFSEERHQMQLIDLSGSGFSVREDERGSVLIPGLLLPQSVIILPGGKKLSCKVQIIYRDNSETAGKGQIHSGIALLDMDPLEHTQLLNFIHQENDSHAFISREVDMNDLWNFFFESGFIYPDKYKYILANKEKIKALYEKLYTRHPQIARHFIYQEGKHIQGHMSMIRSYENSWMLHHHASSMAHSHNAGLQVLNQVGSFTNNCHRNHSFHMNYLMCYYQESNKFPRRVFGDLAEKIAEPKSCSRDDFAYFHVSKEDDIPAPDDNLWSLKKTSSGDIKDLNCFYEKHSGGLMTQALNINAGNVENPTLMEEYKNSGFDRHIDFFSLKREGILHAVIMADRSEAGLNLSDLTNSFKVFIIEPDNITRGVIENALAELFGCFPDMNRIPVLLYPYYHADDIGFHTDKVYTLWVLDTEAGDKYFRYLKTLLRMINH